MGIRVTLREEFAGDGWPVIEELEPLFSHSAETVDSARYPLLSGIDPYGDTVFNGRQLRRVTSETEDLLAAAPDPARKKMLADLLRLCREGTRGVHRYLFFMGD